MLESQKERAHHYRRSLYRAHGFRAGRIEVPQHDFAEWKVLGAGADGEFLAEVTRVIERERSPLDHGASFRIAKGCRYLPSPTTPGALNRLRIAVDAPRLQFLRQGHLARFQNSPTGKLQLEEVPRQR